MEGFGFFSSLVIGKLFSDILRFVKQKTGIVDKVRRSLTPYGKSWGKGLSIMHKTEFFSRHDRVRSNLAAAEWTRNSTITDFQINAGIVDLKKKSTVISNQE